jgi:hypothetical protein
VKLEGPDTVRRALIGYTTILGTLSLIAWMAALVFGDALHKPYPYNTFLFIPEARFTDFTIYLRVPTYEFGRLMPPSWFLRFWIGPADLG